MLNKLAPYYHHTDSTINGLLGTNIAILLIIALLAYFHPYSNNQELYRTTVWILLSIGILIPTILSFMALLEVKLLKNDLDKIRNQ